MLFDVQFRGADEFAVKFKAIKGLKEYVRAALSDAAHESYAYMSANVPYHTGTLARAIQVSNVTYRPGGAGGGGFYEIVVGVDVTQAPHARFVLEGTGLFNIDNPKNGIFPAKGNVMAFEKNGEGTVFTAYTIGQKPQRRWFEEGAELARERVSQAVRGV